MPPNLTFETLAQTFMTMVDERYPSSEKILQIIERLLEGTHYEEIDKVQAKIIILTLMRRAIREVSPTRVYRSLQHRDDLFAAIIEAGEALEDDLEDLQEKAM